MSWEAAEREEEDREVVNRGPERDRSEEWDGWGNPPERPEPGVKPQPLDDQRLREPEWDLNDPVLQQDETSEVRPHRSPELWVDNINGPGMEQQGRNRNCVDCARAVESTWQGSPEVAARLASEDGVGTSQERISDWAQSDFAQTDYPGIEKELEQLGPGSSAIVASDWSGPFGGGHAYNAVNDNGHILFVDGQSGTVEDWPPTKAWKEEDIANCRAIVFDKDGRSCKMELR